jgi:hypothetical protein
MHRARRRAQWRCEAALETDAARGQCVDVGRLVSAPVTADGGHAQVIDEDEDDVGFGRRGPLERKRRGEQARERGENSDDWYHCGNSMFDRIGRENIGMGFPCRVSSCTGSRLRFRQAGDAPLLAELKNSPRPPATKPGLALPMQVR